MPSVTKSQVSSSEPSAEEVAYFWTTFTIAVGGSAKHSRLIRKTLPSKCGVQVLELDGQFSTSKPSRQKLRMTGARANIEKAVEFLKTEGFKVRRVAE